MGEKGGRWGGGGVPVSLFCKGRFTQSLKYQGGTIGYFHIGPFMVSMSTSNLRKHFGYCLFFFCLNCI